MSPKTVEQWRKDRNVKDPVEALLFAVSKHLDSLAVISVPNSGVLMDTARRNDKRPAWIRIATKDEVVKNLKGDDKLADEVLMIRIPRKVIDRMDSRIVLPGEA